MKEEMYIELLYKKLTNELASAEQQLLDTWLKASPENQLLAKQIEKTWQQSLEYKKDYQPNVEGGLSKLKARMNAEQTPAAKVVSMSGRRWFLRVAAAAMILLAAWIAFDQFSGENLDWQQLATTDSIENVDLNDGSKVAVNRNSQFSFPAKFAADERMVMLDGEAFFDIEKDAERPFKIESGKVVVEVLGTSFNVRNYKNENETEITVRSGKVKVSNGAQEWFLEKGEQLFLDKTNNKFRKTKDEKLNALAWFTGKLEFSNEKMDRIKLALEHTFNVELEFTNPNILNCTYTRTLDVESEGLTSILEEFKIAFGMAGYQKTDNGKYQLVGGQCDN